jgi:MFS family permease
MRSKIRFLYDQYPPQYWLMMAGMVISTVGGSMIWPFMLIYASGKLHLPLSTVAALISINAGTGLFSSLVAGSLADRVGRKAVMVFSLLVNGIAYYFLMSAVTYTHFVLVMLLIGLSNPLYQVGADAMLADMIASEKRTEAYAINRIVHNAAFALGPAIGGFLASSSYDLAFYGATSGFVLYGILLLVFAHETLDRTSREELGHSSAAQAQGPAGYARVFQDRGYMAFVLLVAAGLVAPTMLWILMPVYTKTNFDVPEVLYGWIPTTNALMCVFMQYSVTQVTRRYKTLLVAAAGMLIYALGAGSVALMSGFWGFLTSMVILTFGELTLIPTASKYVADIAPADLRGRYMSMYWLSFGLARTLSPLIGGFLNDSFFPQAIWIGGLLIGLASTMGLVLLNGFYKPRLSVHAGP